MFNPDLEPLSGADQNCYHRARRPLDAIHNRDSIMKITKWTHGAACDQEVMEIDFGAVSRTTEGILISDSKSMMSINLSKTELKALKRILTDNG